jgi:hypothetical protein
MRHWVGLVIGGSPKNECQFGNRCGSLRGFCVDRPARPDLRDVLDLPRLAGGNQQIIIF